MPSNAATSPRALAHADKAVDIDPTSSIALVNLASIAFNVGDLDRAVELSRRVAETTDDRGLKGIAEGFVALIESSLDGNVRDLVDLLRSLAIEQEKAGETHFEGITQLNLANALRALGDPAGMLEAATRSIDLLDSSSAGSEVATARGARAWALAHLFGIEAAADEMAAALRETNQVMRRDVLVDLSDIEVLVRKRRACGRPHRGLDSSGRKRKLGQDPD